MRGADGELGLTSSGTRKQQVSEIHTADQEEHAHGGEQQPHRGTDRFSDIPNERLHVDAQIAVGLRILPSEIGRDGAHLCARLRERDAWAEPGNASITKIRAIAELLRRVVQRFPQFVVAAEVVEFRRHDADDFSVVAVQADFAIEDTGIAAETPLPERVAQHDDGDGAVRIELLSFREGAADQWPNAERVKQAGSRAGAADALWLVSTSQIEIGDQAGEG